MDPSDMVGFKASSSSELHKEKLSCSSQEPSPSPWACVGCPSPPTALNAIFHNWPQNTQYCLIGPMPTYEKESSRHVERIQCHLPPSISSLLCMLMHPFPGALLQSATHTLGGGYQPAKRAAAARPGCHLAHIIPLHCYIVPPKGLVKVDPLAKICNIKQTQFSLDF